MPDFALLGWDKDVQIWKAAVLFPIGKLHNFPCFFQMSDVQNRETGGKEKKKALYAQYLSLTMNSKMLFFLLYQILITNYLK